MAYEETLLTIGEVSDLTGVNSVTLRAWQRRYGLLKPQRTPKGHRLYTSGDVSRIRDILNWLDKGVAVSQVKALLETQTGVHEEVEQPDTEYVAVQNALMSLHATALTKQLLDLTKHYPIRVLEKRIFDPLDDWLLRQKSPAMKPYISLWQTALRNTLAYLAFDNAKGKNTRWCWLVGLDENPGYSIYVKALKLQLEGYSVTVLEGVNSGISGLYVSLIDQSVEQLVVFSDQALSASCRKELEEIMGKGMLSMVIAGKCTVIHPELLPASTPKLHGGDHSHKGETQ
ncbi:MerR family transcriptional regulator [Enterovibrio sp. ZSDZ35]|uniref:MerR family transcriptional regulator n=1 Tax=Enterovibrio qingdaonensis TaxID=2899818 RepID=A0ABT5QF90_9GAMM|nr:MerR family transcriptional regulator [Enterovibrio sp. ZSDZ35]MDD1779636.1 MerR family transcriptional regulator [Enterovibrio sp. ZSDZ35]